MQDLKQLSTQDQLASMFAFTIPETLFSYCSAAVSHWKIEVTERLSVRATNNVLTDHSIVSCRLAPHNVQI